MFILHGAWLKSHTPLVSSRLFLWAESSDKRLSQQINVTPLTQRQRTHPFATTPDTVRNALITMNRHFSYMGTSSSAIIYLPSTATTPDLSPQLRQITSIQPTVAHSHRLQPWSLVGLYLSATETTTLLTCQGFDAPPNAWLPGTDLAYWHKIYDLIRQTSVAEQHLTLTALTNQLPQLSQNMPAVACHVFPSHISAVTYLRPDKMDYLQSFINTMLPTITNEPCDVHHLSVLPTDRQGYHACFRVETPTTATGYWTLTYWLQADDDPSLMLSAATIWASSLSAQQKLQQELIRAAKFCPPVARSLQDPQPVASQLTTEETYTFLAETTVLLKQANFNVVTPNWWRTSHKPALAIHLQIDEPPTKKSFVGATALASYSISLAIDHHNLDVKELATIATLKTPLIQIAGQWRELSPPLVQSAIAFIKKFSERPAHIGNLMAMTIAGHTGAMDTENALNVPIVLCSAPEKMLYSLEQLRITADAPARSLPPSFHGTLRSYQQRGLTWLESLSNLGLGACLADDMGLGKTIQIIAYLLLKKERNPTIAPTLVICPLSVTNNWSREFMQFAPNLRVALHHGHDRLTHKRFIELAFHHDVIITTYHLAHLDNALLSGIPWDDLVLDEAQNIKNPLAQQTVSIRKLPARHRIALTGTPVENSLSELWSIMHFLNPGYLGTLKKFRRNFIIPIENNHETSKEEQLRQLINPLMLRRLKTDQSIALDLPAKQETKVYCHLTKEQATLYAAVLDVMLPQIEKAEFFMRKALIASTLTKLKQICNHPAHFLKDGSTLPNRSGKLIRLEAMLSELKAVERRALIFTQYTEMGHLLAQYLENRLGETPFFLHGALSQRKRDQMITQFQSDKLAPHFFILSLNAGGVGINLTRADTVFHYDRWWNPAVENQATDRIFRIGQTQKVQVYKFICTATLEEKIDEMIEAKKTLADHIVSANETWLSELSTADLKKFLKLNTN